MPAGTWDGTVAAIVGGLVGAVTGSLTSWAVSYYAAKKTRHESKVDQIEAMVDSLREAAMAYWRSSGRNEALERIIVTKLDSLASKLELMHSRRHISQVELGTAEAIRSELWDVATGDDFETAARVADPAKVERIRDLCDGICRAVEVD